MPIVVNFTLILQQIIDVVRGQLLIFKNVILPTVKPNFSYMCSRIILQ